MPRHVRTHYSRISDQVDDREISLVLEALGQALEATTRGAVVEFGCFVGTTSLFISRLLRMQKCTREFSVYDSFEGLPEKSFHDVSPTGEQFTPGALSASKKQFIENYKKAGLPLPHIHKAWFSELSPDDVPNEVAFGFFDGDYYHSIRDSLQLVTPKLVAGAVLVVDDYANNALPGVAQAVDEWLQRYPSRLRTEHSLAIIDKIHI